jgi:hypothetical protein
MAAGPPRVARSSGLIGKHVVPTARLARQAEVDFLTRSEPSWRRAFPAKANQSSAVTRPQDDRACESYLTRGAQQAGWLSGYVSRSWHGLRPAGILLDHAAPPLLPTKMGGDPRCRALK